MRAKDFIEGELVKVIVHDGKYEILGYIEEINNNNNRIYIRVAKSNFEHIECGQLKSFYPKSDEYIVEHMRWTSPETLYDMMDFALYKRDFDLAAEIHERMYN